MIRLAGVVKSYDGGRTRAVDGVDLSVAAGELVVLLGESGCGKTTTLKAINRLVELDAGRVEVDGRDVTEVDPIELRRGIGYAIQAVGLFPHRTVIENVETVPRLVGWDERRAREAATRTLEKVGLDVAALGERYPDELSGGQAQRVGVARALAAEPRVLLLDEPFGALDPVTRSALQAEFDSLRRSFGVTAVLVTHDVGEALLLADRIAVMQAGRIVALGTPAEMLRAPGHPYAEALLATPRRQVRAIAALLDGEGER